MIRYFRSSIFLEVFLVIFISFFTIFSIIGFSSYLNQKTTLEQLFQDRAKIMAESFVLLSSNAIILEDSTLLYDMIQNYIKKNKQLKTIIIKTTNSDYLIVGKKNWSYDTTIDDFLIKNQRDEEKSFYYNSSFVGDVFHYIYPIVLSEISWGWLHLSLDIEEYQIQLDKLYLKYLGLFATMFLITVLSSLFIAKIYTQPILLFNEVAKKVSRGDLKQNVTIQKNNEIGQFASSFNTMINNLAKSKEELLGTNNELQKEIIKRKEQETILVQQSRFIAMGEMISMIAHQWRQPLNSIGLIVQNLELRAKMSGTDDKSLSDNVDKVMKILEQMSKTIEDFRNFFKPNKSINSFSLYEMVNSVYLLIEDSLSAKGIDVKIEKSDLQISCYESELSQVIINLINNSRDALADNKVDNPYINISFAQIDSDNVQIVIKDNAGGIPLEIQEKIFDPYFSTKEDRNGTGIGLYMSKVIIEKNMLGKLYFNNLENGVEFIIQLKKALTIGD